MPLAVVESPRLYRQIADQLRHLIDQHEFPVGSRLPPEDPDDPAEIWGQRIGRGLAFAVAAGLVIYLVVTYIR